MVSTLLKLTTIFLMMNIFLYLGMNLGVTESGEEIKQDLNFHLEGDLLQKLVGTSIEDIADSTKENFTDYDLVVNSNFTSFPQLQGGEEIGVGGISFLDAIRISIDFAKLLFNIALSPVTLFTNFRLPAILIAMIGLPYMIIFVITIMMFIRGVGD